MDFLWPLTSFESAVSRSHRCKFYIRGSVQNSILIWLFTASHWFWTSRSHRFYGEIAVQCRIPFWLDFLRPLTVFESAIVTRSTLRSQFSVEFHLDWTFYGLSLVTSVLKVPYIENLLSEQLGYRRWRFLVKKSHVIVYFNIIDKGIVLI